MIPLPLIPLTALGNRIAGNANTHAWGIAVIALAFIATYPALHWPAWFAIATLVVLARSPSPRAWLHMTQKDQIDWVLAVERAVLIVPLALFLYWKTGVYWHLLAASLFPIIPVFYWVAGKQKRFEPVALAEILTGAYMGML